MIEREDGEDEVVAVESLVQWQMVGEGSEKERRQGLVETRGDILDQQGVGDVLSWQREGRTPAQLQLKSCILSHLHLSWSQGKAWGGGNKGILIFEAVYLTQHFA